MYNHRLDISPCICRYYIHIIILYWVICICNLPFSLSFYPSLYRNTDSAHPISTHNLITFIFFESIQNLICWWQVKKPLQSIYVTNEKRIPYTHTIGKNSITASNIFTYILNLGKRKWAFSSWLFFCHISCWKIEIHFMSVMRHKYENIEICKIDYNSSLRWICYNILCWLGFFSFDLRSSIIL